MRALVLFALATACTAEAPTTPTKTAPAKTAPSRAPAAKAPSLDPPPAKAAAAPNAPKPLPVTPVELTAADGTKVFGDHYGVEQDKPAPIILLFHQAGSNAGEYAPIAPRLQTLGFAALAIDQRSGGERWGTKNRTVDALGKSTKYLPTYPDLEAALAWAAEHGHTKIAVWGSSYSAALVFKLASEHPDQVSAVLAFSPGEYIGKEGTVAGWAKGVDEPIFVTSAPGEEVAAAKAILDASPSTQKTQFEPAKGVHGSSILREDRTKEGSAPAWQAVEAFLTNAGQWNP